MTTLTLIPSDVMLFCFICNLLYINASAKWIMGWNKYVWISGLTPVHSCGLPSVTVSLFLGLWPSTFVFLWSSNLLQNPSLGFQRDCSMRGFSSSPITRRHSVSHWWDIPVRPITSQRTYAFGSSVSRQYLWKNKINSLLTKLWYR